MYRKVLKKVSLDKFMRLIVLFDLPTLTKTDVRNYRKFVKFLTSEGFIRVQYSVYCKLCINNDSINTYKKRLETNSPADGDIRYLAITEKQYLGIKNINNTYSLEEQITNVDRTVIIGGMNENN